MYIYIYIDTRTYRYTLHIRHRAAGTSGVIANVCCWSAIPSLLVQVCHPQSAGLLFLRGLQGSLSAAPESPA